MKPSQRSTEIFKAIRKKHRISQAELAESLKISQSRISKIENGTLTLSIDVWFEFCRMFSIDPAILGNKLWEKVINK